jgi:hypothetical protein
MLSELINSLTLEFIYSIIGFIVFWSVTIIIVSVLSLFLLLKIYDKWTSFWVDLSNRQWRSCEPKENEYPSMKEIKKSWIFLQIAHPVKYGLLENSEEHKKEWKEKIESKQE